MHNKRHNILDDAWDMDSSIMGGAAHTMRVGLVTNTVMQAKPIVIDSLDDLVVSEPTFKATEVEGDLPVLLNFSHGDMQIAILVVYDKDSGHVQCYPFNDLEGKWWLYEMAFDITPDGLIEIRPVHPLVEYGDPTKEMMDHLEALALVVHLYLHNVQNDLITLEEETQDFSKINRKRVKNKKTPIVNNWIIKYVDRNETAI